MRLLIFDATDRKPHALLQELGSSKDIDFTFTGDPDVLAAALAQRNHDLCLVLLRSEPSHDLVEQLSKARSLPPGGLVSVHASAAPEGVRAMLALGARAVFAEPIAPHRLLQAIRVRLHGSGPTVPLGVFAERNPAACELRTFGRLARLAADRPGELFVETDLPLEPGARVVLVNELPERFGTHRASFEVLSREHEDLYYGFHHGYWLGRPDDPRFVSGWAAFCERHRDQLARPRPKVVWVSERRLASIERWLPPAAWSIHPCRASRVHSVTLGRVDPEVVVLDDPSPAAHDTVTAWASATGRRVLRTPRAPADGLPLLPLDERFAATWAERVADLPRRDGALLYPARGAELSRCTLAVPGELVATSPTGFEVSTSQRLPEDAVLEVTDCDLARYRPTGVFGRVVRTETHRVRCELMPIGDDPQLTLVRGTRDSVSVAPRPVARPTGSHSAPHHPRSRLEPVTVATVGALMAATAARTWVAMHPGSGAGEAQPASTEEVIDAIGKAFE